VRSTARPLAKQESGNVQYKCGLGFAKQFCGKGFAKPRLMFLKFRKGFFGFRRAGRVREEGTAGFEFWAGAMEKINPKC